MKILGFIISLCGIVGLLLAPNGYPTGRDPEDNHSSYWMVVGSTFLVIVGMKVYKSRRRGAKKRHRT